MHPPKPLHVAALLFALVWSTPAVLAADQRLLSLVPPSAESVTGINNRIARGHHPAFALVTDNSFADASDFSAISGVDQDIAVEQVILVGNMRAIGTHAEHSLLASGHFDKDRIFKSAIENGAGAAEYRGVPIAVLSPFSRERKYFHDLRWLAVLDDKIILLGTLGQVREELDRYLNKADADPFLRHKVAQLDRDDMSWSLVPRLVQSGDTLRALESLDPRFATLIHEGDTLLLGIRYGRRVRFEYEVTSSDRSLPLNSHSTVQSLRDDTRISNSLFPAPRQNGASVRGKLEISRNHYEEWLVNIAVHTRLKE